jgi:hypothetical protein
MGKVYQQIDDSLARLIRSQHVFFVATAPLNPAGHLNLSPKGLNSFRILDSTTVAYLDLTGSGVETIAHVRENGRIVLMFCTFEGAPKVLRLYGRGDVIEPDHPRFTELRDHFDEQPGMRAIIVVSLDRIADSCGWGVPRYRYESERSQLIEWAEKKGQRGLDEYRAAHNTSSIDGLPGVQTVNAK